MLNKKEDIMIHFNYEHTLYDSKNEEYVEEEVLITSKDFPVGKTSETGATVAEDTVAVVLYDLEDLDNFDVFDTFEDAQESAFEYPVLAVKKFGDVTVDYMQGWFDNNFFS